MGYKAVISGAALSIFAGTLYLVASWTSWSSFIINDGLALNYLRTSYPFRPTGSVRSYNFTLRRVNQTVDGLTRSAILVNGEFPGPLIEADYGDTISVTVNNEIEDPPEGTAIHWHGMLQTGTPWYDGVSGVTQCPIGPGKSFTYEFLADQYGTSWYHAHYSSQYGAGIFGPMVIHGPRHAAYDDDAGVIMLTDYYGRYYRDVLGEVLRPRPFPAAPPSDHNLINGRGDMRCELTAGPAPCPDASRLFKLRLARGRTHRLRLLNAGAEGMQRFSIDGLALRVIAADFVPIEPYETPVVTLAVGQRADVLVTVPEGAAGNRWMRSYISDICSFSNHHPAYGVVYFDDPDATPSSLGHEVDDTDCGAEPIDRIHPVDPEPAATEPDITDVVAIGNHPNATGQWIWTMNGYVAEADISKPAILDLARGQAASSFPVQWNLYDYGDNRTVRIVLENPIDFPHPMHLHGHNFKILAEGLGKWDGHIVNPRNPARRDTQMVRSLGYLVIEIDADRPGLWPFHCHIGPHLSAGLSVTLMTKPALIPQMQVPETLWQTCESWRRLAADTPDQIDSGLSVDELRGLA
ncbi:hypothetical protein DL765_001487 [Monosporascus sp. GIB2]|nr:hypothetical protein DL765_001487 [Monosporascus sp. GIB2]